MYCAAQPCTARALNVIVGIPLCLDHIQQIRATLNGEAVPVAVAPISGESLVYYAPHPTKPLIKIGVTQNLHKRMRGLGVRRVLATEPGGYRLERKRHGQFASLRVSGSEWFRSTDWLLQHTANLVRDFGPGRCNCTSAACGFK
jgi:hypothetical protein